MNVKHLLKQAFKFYRLAAPTVSPTESIWTKEDYDEFVHELPHHTLSQIIDVIGVYHNKEYFKLSTFLLQIALSRIGYGILETVKELQKHNIPEPIIREIATYIADKILESDSFDKNDYFFIEKVANWIPRETLAKAQKKIIMKLISAFQNDMKRLEQGPVFYNYRSAEGLWFDLYSMSTTLPKEWLVELAKRFGVDFYSYTNAHIVEEQKKYYLNEKEKLNIYDVASLLYRSLTSDEMKEIINKADKEAFEYMRRFLYSDFDFVKNDYMLDENGKLMDDNYKTVDWPPLVKAETVKSITNQDIKDKWMKIFEEFNVIPV